MGTKLGMLTNGSQSLVRCCKEDGDPAESVTEKDRDRNRDRESGDGGRGRDGETATATATDAETAKG